MQSTQPYTRVLKTKTRQEKLVKVVPKIVVQNKHRGELNVKSENKKTITKKKSSCNCGKGFF